MSPITLLIINGVCSFVGSSIGAFFGVRSWFKRQGITVESEEDIE
jgi:hypothetical protein